MECLINTTRKQEFLDITGLVDDAVKEDGINNGVVTVFVPHTTAGLTINENCDPDVVTDIIEALNKTYPVENGYLHLEGNSHAHIKASLMGASINVIIEGGRLKLGMWQGIYFCEFDGPRSRKIYIKTMRED